MTHVVSGAEPQRERPARARTYVRVARDGADPPEGAQGAAAAQIAAQYAGPVPPHADAHRGQGSDFAGMARAGRTRSRKGKWSGICATPGCEDSNRPGGISIFEPKKGADYPHEKYRCEPCCSRIADLMCAFMDATGYRGGADDPESFAACNAEAQRICDLDRRSLHRSAAGGHDVH